MNTVEIIVVIYFVINVLLTVLTVNAVIRKNRVFTVRDLIPLVFFLALALPLLFIALIDEVKDYPIIDRRKQDDL